MNVLYRLRETCFLRTGTSLNLHENDTIGRFSKACLHHSSNSLLFTRISTNKIGLPKGPPALWRAGEIRASPDTGFVLSKIRCNF